MERNCNGCEFARHVVRVSKKLIKVSCKKLDDELEYFVDEEDGIDLPLIPGEWCPIEDEPKPNNCRLGFFCHDESNNCYQFKLDGEGVDWVSCKYFGTNTGCENIIAQVNQATLFLESQGLMPIGVKEYEEFKKWRESK